MMLYKPDRKQNGKGYLASRAGNFNASTVLLDNCFCWDYADDQLLAAYHHGVFDQDGCRDYGLAADDAFDCLREKA